MWHGEMKKEAEFLRPGVRSHAIASRKISRIGWIPRGRQAGACSMDLKRREAQQVKGGARLIKRMETNHESILSLVALVAGVLGISEVHAQSEISLLSPIPSKRRLISLFRTSKPDRCQGRDNLRHRRGTRKTVASGGHWT